MLWDLPGPKTWLNSIVNHAFDGRPTIVACPSRWSPDAFSEALENELDRQRFDVLRILPGVIDATNLTTAVWAIAEEAGIRRPAGSSFGLDELFRRAELAGTVCVVDARSEDETVSNAWIEFAQGVAQAAQVRPSDERFGLVTIIDGPTLANLPSADPHLAVLWWWGVVRPLDCAVFLDARAMRPVEIAETIELGRWDLELVDQLSADGFDSTVEPPVGGGKPATAQIKAHGSPAPDTPIKYLSDWAAGTIQSWDGVVDVHIAFTNDRSQRLWLGQVRTLFPWLERIRTELADRVETEAARRHVDASDIRDLELSKLKGWLFDHHVRLPPAEYTTLRLATDARHCLAHLKVVEPALLEDLRQATAAARIRLFV